MGDIYVKLHQKETILHKDASIMYGWAMNGYLPYDEIKLDRNVKLQEILSITDDSDIGYFIEVDLKYADEKKESKQFSICS